MDEINEKSIDSSSQEPKIGVFICHCGGNISNVVDVKAVAAALSDYPGVALSTDYVFMCSSTGQDMVEEAIRKQGVNRLVIAACSPALHELTFRGALERAGLNPYLYEHVNIREQDSWVHKSDPEAATQKAIRLVKAAVQKISRQDPLNAIGVDAMKAVAVVGGGIAGMSAALALAKLKFNVHLIEKAGQLGGKLNNVWKAYPSGEDGREIARRLSTEIASFSNIEVLLNTEVKDVDGYVGNFTVETENSAGSSTQPIKAGAIIITSGFESYVPAAGEYQYTNHPNIVTLPQFVDMLKDDAGDGFKDVRSVAFIHCVGSRQAEPLDKPQADGKVNDYCSRICCTAAFTRIQQLLDRHPDIQVYDFYRDIRTYGLQHETYYEDLSRRGVVFFRYPDSVRPKVVVADGKISVSCTDILTWNEEVEVDADLLVLSTGVKPADISLLVDKLKLPIGSDGFLLEAHPKLRPVEVPNLGIYIGGAAQAPMDLMEAACGGKAAASKAAQLLAAGEIMLDPFVASVIPDLCDGCGACVSECLYPGAVVMEDGKARVVSAQCKGCGACAAVCHTRAINLAGYSLDQLDAMVDAIARS